MAKVRYTTFKRAAEMEAEKRICAVLDPYIENLHSVHESHIRSIVRELKEQLLNEFENFGFEYEELQ